MGTAAATEHEHGELDEFHDAVDGDATVLGKRGEFRALRLIDHVRSLSECGAVRRRDDAVHGFTC